MGRSAREFVPHEHVKRNVSQTRTSNRNSQQEYDATCIFLKATRMCAAPVQEVCFPCVGLPDRTS